MMKWMGLTGGIATGKSAVTQVLRDLGYPVVDADVLARQAVGPGTEALGAVVDAFGKEILLPDQSLDRKKLGALVFGQKAKLETLEKILHPEIRRLMLKDKDELKKAGATLAFYDVPLLFEKNLVAQFDGVIVVGCLEEEQILRLMKRDQLSRPEALKRIQTQIPIAAKMAAADFVIDNSGTLSQLKSKVENLMTKLLPS